ncbi:MAG: hypothetical protein KDM91_08350, partial [Verrucomicrobiae bacterium]|nr:hypothetical protein [Verrucomicrobiae bacterium]
FELLTPDRRLLSVGYALNAARAESVKAGGITAGMIADGSISANHLALTEDSGNYSGGIGTDSVVFAQTFDAAPPVTVNAAGFEDAVTVSNRTASSFDLTLNFAQRQIDGATTAAGEYVSMAIVNGRPAVAYYDASNHDLLYARAQDAAGNEWNAPVTVEDDGGNTTGIYPTLLEIGGRPAIAYQNLTRGEMRYKRADDADGAAWTAAPVTIAASGAGYYCRSAVIGGRPAVAYWSNSTGRVYYCRASDATGAAWPAPVLADTFGGGFGMSQQMGLAEVNGLPAIAFVYTNYSLYYARATAVDGSGAWSTTVTPASGVEGLVERHFSWPITLTVVDGQPAIFFSRRGDYGSRPAMLRAPDANGTTASSWTLTEIDTVPTRNLAGVADLGGTPAVTCWAGDNTLSLYRATSADGSAWGPAQVVRSSIGQPAWNAPLEVDGRPAVSYYYINSGDLFFAALPTNISWTAATAGAFPLQADSVGAGGVDSLAIADGSVAIGDLSFSVVTSVTAGNGLTGGGTGDVTLSVAAGGITSTEIANGTIVLADLASTAYAQDTTANALVQRDGNGRVKLAVGTGTYESPDNNQISRRLNSRDYVSGRTVAKTDELILERDGNYGGMRIRWDAALARNQTIALQAMTSTGAAINRYFTRTSSTAAGNLVLFTDAESVVYFRCQFGNTYSFGGHQSTVELSRYTGDYYWYGTLASSVDQ